jgi:DNA-binding response OmpR family regulator
MIITARDDADSKVRAMRAGAKEYILKPFDAEELLQKIQQLTRRR